jgi:hypothetical protein
MIAMELPLLRMLAFAIAATATIGVAADLPASERKPRTPGLGVVYDDHGTPIIMEGYRSPRRARDADRSTPEAKPRRKVRRGSSTYIPPPVPAPGPSGPTLQPTPPPVQPRRLDTFCDRVTRCLHSFPLNAGVGHNPTDRDAYVRQCAN